MEKGKREYNTKLGKEEMFEHQYHLTPGVFEPPPRKLRELLNRSTSRLQIRHHTATSAPEVMGHAINH